MQKNTHQIEDFGFSYTYIMLAKKKCSKTYMTIVMLEKVINLAHCVDMKVQDGTTCPPLLNYRRLMQIFKTMV